MQLTDYELDAERGIEQWQKGDDSLVRQAFDLAMRPVDWVSARVASDDAMRQADEMVSRFFHLLGDATRWTVSLDGIIEQARAEGVQADTVEDLRGATLEMLDPVARRVSSRSAVAAALQGGGTGLGGLALIAADIPALFAINLRLIQQTGASYGFDLRSPDYQPLVMAVLNVAACGTASARHQALREMSVAGSAFAAGARYLGHVSGAFSAQNRNVPREIAKQLLGRKLAQTIPLAGAAVGAGVNYWFTGQAAEAAYMCTRALHLECKRRAA